jgi:hypothetical protein
MFWGTVLKEGEPLKS